MELHRFFFDCRGIDTGAANFSTTDPGDGGTATVGAGDIDDAAGATTDWAARR